jgi:hypothetical protein
MAKRKGGRKRPRIKVVNTNNKTMKKTQLSKLSIPKSHDQRMYKFGYDDGYSKAKENIIKIIEEMYKNYDLGTSTYDSIKKELGEK